ncbi:MAG: GumC family protein [Syntrophomonadaceae bacterium]
MELEIDQDQKKGAKFSDYLYVLYKWRRFLFVSLLIVTIGATVYAFLLPKSYKATTVVMVPPDNSMGLSGLTSLLSGKGGSASIGAKIFGITNTSEDMLIGLLNSRTALMDVINKFQMQKYYETENMDKTLKALSEDVSFGPNDNGMIEISVINKSPEKSAEIANYFVQLLDSLNIKFSVEQARNNRKFIEKRYLKNVEDLRMAEDSLYRFQKKYGIFAVPEQMEVAVKAAGEIEAQLAEKEMAAFFTKQQYGENSPQYQGVEAQVKMLRAKVSELKNANRLSSESNVLFPFKQAPDISINYLRSYREVEIQQKIMEVILPMYEQTKFEEQKSLPAVQVVDKAYPPQLKYAPKKALIILTITFIAAFFFIAIAYKGEGALKRYEYRNPLEESETKFFRKISKIFKIKN